MQAVKVTMAGKDPVMVSVGTRVSELLPAVSESGYPVLGAIGNNQVMSLNTRILTDLTLVPLCVTDPEGWTIYRNSLAFLLAKVAHEHFPDESFRVRNSFGAGLYCTLDWAKDRSKASIEEAIQTLKQAMAEAIRQDLPIVPEVFSYEAADRLLQEKGQLDKLNLLAYRNDPVIVMVHCGDFWELGLPPLVTHLGLVPLFDLVPKGDGLILTVPTSDKPDTLPNLRLSDHLLGVYREHIRWGKIVGITTTGALNRAIVEKHADDFVRTVEALHDKKLANIADAIVAREHVRLVLVAGPSSAGKTTFAKRLVTHLRVNGCKPLLISTDNYFVGDELNPRDENGNLDYEHIEAMDLKRLNSDMLRLMAGEVIHLRKFDFKTRSGYDDAVATRLPGNGMIVMEGIHSLNPRLTSEIPAEQKFMIFINAMTQLGVDCNNRISTTDTRKIRRIVRDHQFRGRPAIETLRMWPSVARGEKRWIYPFQQNADAVFNSALDYELSVLKPIASPLLKQIKPWDPEYLEAVRLSDILLNFAAMNADRVPGDSILREYIGGSQLTY